MSDDVRSPERVAEGVVTEAPDPGWLREVIDELERRLHASELEWVEAVWGLSQEELAAAFGVSAETLTRWARAGVPDEHRDDLAELVAATEELLAYVRRQQIPTVVRRNAEALGGESLEGLVTAGRLREAREAIERIFDLRSSQP